MVCKDIIAYRNGKYINELLSVKLLFSGNTVDFSAKETWTQGANLELSDSNKISYQSSLRGC